MSNKTSLLLILALVAASIASLPRVCAEEPDRSSFESVITCDDQYSALLARAKEQLSKGDRAGALRSLLAARAQLQRCKERDQGDSGDETAIALNSL